MSTRTRLEALQWFALFGGALAWTTQHVVGYFASTAGCSKALVVDVHPAVWQVTLALVAGTVVVSAEAAAFLVYRATADADGDSPGPAGRMHFLATAALLGNVLFLIIVVLDAVGSLANLPCRRS